MASASGHSARCAPTSFVTSYVTSCAMLQASPVPPHALRGMVQLSVAMLQEYHKDFRSTSVEACNAFLGLQDTPHASLL